MHEPETKSTRKISAGTDTGPRELRFTAAGQSQDYSMALPAGWSETKARKILGGNWLRVYEQVWGG